MSDVLLIEETGDRAIRRLHQLLTLVLLGFEEGEARARALANAEPRRIIDPVASACFGEARELLVRGALFAALFALEAAALREPECYGPTHQTVRKLVLDSLERVVALEMANAEYDADDLASESTLN
jgi:hypothetical protein